VETQRVGGIEALHHGGSVSGYKSDWVVLPDARVAAVLLVSGDSGWALVSALRRKLIELVYDAQPQADALVAAEAKGLAERLANERAAISRVAIEQADLASRYANPLLGTIDVRRGKDGTVFDFGPWRSEMGARKDADALGGHDFVSISPSVIDELAFIPGRDGEMRTLTLRDSQHTYVYREGPPR
jgi:hypothetical protein